MYDKKCLDQLKEVVSLVDIVEGHVHLQRFGHTLKALCPFHQEKTPSFVVKDSSPYYHCFGCGAHGDAITFLMHTQNYSFRDAIEWLADRYRIPLFNATADVNNKLNKDLLSLQTLLKEASSIFHWILFYTEEGRKTLRYLQDRGFDVSDCILFTIVSIPGRNKV